MCIEQHGIAGYELMQRAGLSLFQQIQSRYPDCRSMTIFCGAGNNAGDGYVIATLARAAGIDAEVWALIDPQQLQGDAATAAQAYLEDGGAVELDFDSRKPGDLVVDAILGTGLDRPVEGCFLEVINRVNAMDAPVVSVDIPSGLNADTGTAMPTAIRAELTVGFIGQKRGLYTGQAVDYTGALEFDDLGAPDAIYQAMPKDAELLHESAISQHLPSREPSTHKGQLGHVLVAGSDHGYPGAVALAARAALMAGSGLVSVATRQEHAVAMAAALPEVMWADGEAFERLDRLVQRADVVALGPGLGDSDWSRRIWHRLASAGLPMVLDADGLNCLQQAPRQCLDWVLTPHPGEAARLLNCSVDDIQADRYAAVRTLAEQFCATVVLKGAGSLIANPEGAVRVCPYGNPAMATAGMGDALTGIIASLLGQGLDGFDAASTGVLLHALAGDQAAVHRRQVIASELITALSSVLPK